MFEPGNFVPFVFLFILEWSGECWVHFALFVDGKQNGTIEPMMF